MRFGNRMHCWLGGPLCFLALGMLAGCGSKGAEYTVAPARGKVVCQGQPVKGGHITFRPVQAAQGKAGITGRPASAEVKEDGTFVLSTYGKEDGAVVGKHEITYLPAVTGAQSYQEKPRPSPYAGMVPKPKEVEVKPGRNEFTIELVPGR